MPRIGDLLFPDPPADASPIVREAYTEGLSPNRVGLTKDDLRLLRRGVRRGELWYGPDPNWPHWIRWLPIITLQQEDVPC
jgi:hypothetical protein